jgi:hypothetical protein
VAQFLPGGLIYAGLGLTACLSEAIWFASRPPHYAFEAKPGIC